MTLDKKQIDKIVLNALEEDMPYGDVTTDNLIPEDDVTEAKFIAKAEGVIAGMPVAARVFELIDNRISVEIFKNDGDKVEKGDIIAILRGPTAGILKGERTALNLMQRLSGIATRTNVFTELVKDYDVSVADTRKTTPGLRYLEKYAVRCGGGRNHRYSLSDAVMLKDNHIAAGGGILSAVAKVRANIPHTVKIEVEVEDMEMVRQAVESGADIIMLDNMNEAAMAEAVKYIDGRALVEASGDVTEERIRAIAETGVDIISIGRITHSVKALDISLRFKV
ncbi:MAG: carboxylating nicotinate-nucleotide diphosphorylase [Clostridia bacterium]|nr:carboxylating nicotinate-nucleotide diphosphorylase [Clostridia bacterium]MBR5785413.1 carboxylating nicotinate-nucleotide diphosphorylase [Clostridia bacterium]